MARPKKVHKYDYTIRTLAYYQQKGGLYNDIITILQNERQNNQRDRLNPPATILNEACYMIDDSNTSGSDIIADMEEFKHLNHERLSSGTIDLIFACVYVLAYNDLSEGARHEIIRLMDHRYVDVTPLFMLAEAQEPQKEVEPEHDDEPYSEAPIAVTKEAPIAKGRLVRGKIIVDLPVGPFGIIRTAVDPKVVKKYQLDEDPESVKLMKDLTKQLAAKEKQIQELRKSIGGGKVDAQVKSYKEDIRLFSELLSAARKDLEKERSENKLLKDQMKHEKELSDKRIEDLQQTCEIRDLEKSKLRQELDELKDSIENQIRNKTIDIRTVDDILTFEYLLNYIEEKEVYDEVRQIFDLLKKAMRRVATDEQFDRMDALEKKMLHNSLPSIHNHNQISNSNVFPGVVNNPNFPMGVGMEELQKMFIEFVNKMLNNGKQE